MRQEWRTVLLKDVLQPKGYIRGPFGSALKRGDMLDTGIPVYEQQHAIYGSRQFRFHISENKYMEMKRFSIQPDDIIISCSGTVGRVSIITKDDPIGIISQALLLLRVNVDIIDPLFLCYFFRSYEGYNAIVSRSSGSVQVNISKREVIEQIPLRLPDIQTQRRIVSILNSLDQKIVCNAKINDNLQQQAMALYSSMFLDNPALESTAGTLKDIADVTMGQSPSGSSYNEDGNGEVFYQGRAEFGYRFPTRRLFTTEPKRMAEAGDVLLSVRAPVGDLNVAYERCCIGRGLGAIHGRNGYQSFVLYTMFALRPQLDVYNGEGTVFGSINRNALNDMPIEIPSDEAIAAFEAVVRPMDDMIRINYEENRRLQELRDSLLPRLMSGEVDVSNLDI